MAGFDYSADHPDPEEPERQPSLSLDQGEIGFSPDGENPLWRIQSRSRRLPSSADATSDAPSTAMEALASPWQAPFRVADHGVTGELEPIVALYMREIDRVPLLSPQEELALGREISQGQEAAAQLRRRQLSRRQRERLEATAARGRAAAERLMESNLRLVVSVAKRHVGRGLPLLDLIQEGNLGLARAVEKFDYRRGFKFSTYAYWWIRQAVARAVADQGRTIRIPVHVSALLARAATQSRRLQQDLVRDPSSAELAAAIGVRQDHVETLLKATTQPISLETTIGHEDDRLADLIADGVSQTPPDQAELGLLKEELEIALHQLTRREEQIVRLRFGLDDEHARTLSEVGTILGLSRERVRQIEAEALAKLRRPELRSKWAEYLE